MSIHSRYNQAISAEYMNAQLEFKLNILCHFQSCVHTRKRNYICYSTCFIVLCQVPIIMNNAEKGMIISLYYPMRQESKDMFIQRRPYNDVFTSFVELA